MSKVRDIFFGLTALLVILSGCAKQPVLSVPEGDISVSLALSVHGSIGTKMSGSITQQNFSPESFRGIDRIYILPFRTGNPDTPIQAGDVPWDVRLALPQAGVDGTFTNVSGRGLILNNYAHFYERVYLRPETDAVLVYGQAPDHSSASFVEGAVAFKQHNGVLEYTDLDDPGSAGNIRFSPVSVIGEQGSETHTEYNENWKSPILGYLNDILKASPKGKSNYVFHTPSSYNNHPEMKAAFEEFINEGIYFPLSADVLGYKLSRLYRALYPLATDKSRSADYHEKNGYAYVYELANTVLTKIYNDATNATNPYATRTGNGTSTTITMTQQAPAAFGLPAGTLPIQFKESEDKKSRNFQILYNVDPLSGLAYIPEKRICYPPSLWYFANSPLVTSEDDNMEDKYTSDYTWDDIRSNYTSGAVGMRSQAAAVRDPLQYGVALLRLNCQKVASSTTIKDYKGTTVNVDNENFPLTGIILSDQYPLDFQFTPLPDNTDVKMKYIYDADVIDEQGKALAFLTKRANTTNKAVTTLVFPTRSGADVRFALEFLNNSNNTLIGANNCKIYPKCHFYLAGVLAFANRVDNSGKARESVFVRDCVTDVNVSFSALKSIYDVVPDLTDPQLQIGVKAEFGWNLSTPGDVPIVIQ